MLAQHPQVFTVPETHYFRKIRGRFGDRAAGPFVSPRAASRALDSLVAAVAASARPSVPRWWPFKQRYVRSFVSVMDDGASRYGATVWVEKSPIHLHHLEEITEAVPGVGFVHLARDGRDVVASLVNLCELEPDLWVPQLLPDQPRSSERRTLIDAAVARWNADFNRSLEWQGSRSHFHVTYDGLVDALRPTLEGIAAFLEIPYDPAMERHWESADEVVGPRREKQHMAKTFQPLEDRRLHRFRTFFTESEQERIVAGLTGGGDTGAVAHS